MSILSASQARQKRGIIAMLVMFFVFTVIFYIKSNRVEDITFGFVVDKEWQLLNEWKLSSKRGAALLFSAGQPVVNLYHSPEYYRALLCFRFH